MREIKDIDDQRKILELDPFFEKITSEIVINKKLVQAEVCFMVMQDY